MSDKLEILDSEDRSISVAEARHLARKHMLIRALELLFEIGCNSDNKPMDRVSALRYVADFAAEAQGGGTKIASQLSPQAARLIARMGLKEQNGQAPEKPDSRNVRTDSPEGKRLRSGNPDDGKGGPDTESGGRLGPASGDGTESDE